MEMLKNNQISSLTIKPHNKINKLMKIHIKKTNRTINNINRATCQISLLNRKRNTNNNHIT